MALYTIRVPDGWRGLVGSRLARMALAAFLRQPSALPPDPGASETRLCLSLPRGAVRRAALILGNTESVALRRIIAGKKP
ncbi:MAG: hypothetical protein ACRD4Q_14495 [Candidatus Acidiferrales bacterium]